MQLTKHEHIGASQLIRSVGRTYGESVKLGCRISPSRAVTSLKVVLIWRATWSVALTAAGTAGCVEMGAAVGRGVLEVAKSPAKLPPCSLAAEDSTQFVDSPVVSRWAYDGRIRPRHEVAALFVRSILGHATGVTMVYADALDGRVDISDVQPDRHARLPFESSDCVVQDCFRVALLEGTHMLTLHAVSEERGRRPSVIRSRVQFAAEAGGLYSIHGCQAGSSHEPLFWVRDEKSLKCVSDRCPRE
jgi:hypothetical protein